MQEGVLHLEELGAAAAAPTVSAPATPSNPLPLSTPPRKVLCLGMRAELVTVGGDQSLERVAHEQGRGVGLDRVASESHAPSDVTADGIRP